MLQGNEKICKFAAEKWLLDKSINRERGESPRQYPLLCFPLPGVR